MLYHIALAESDRLAQQINALKKQLEHLPEGKLICTRNGTHFKWYQSNDGDMNYIPKHERHLAEQLAEKKYLSMMYEELVAEKAAIDQYLNQHPTSFGNVQSLLTNPSEYRTLLSDRFKPLSQELSDWAHAPYESNPHYPEQLIHKSISGNNLRSKSESLIDMFLHINQIPFRYEAALILNNTTYYPDFTIRHPISGKLYYWEHFGLMDNPVYAQNAFSKLQFYSSQGIIPSIQLITTFETKDHPLDTTLIEKIISHYFLNN
ncbi:MAG: ATPase [Lachnospiraceae bacterium]|nr:ATPase [Lachnospiraceae bacterium]